MNKYYNSHVKMTKAEIATLQEDLNLEPERGIQTFISNLSISPFFSFSLPIFLFGTIINLLCVEYVPESITKSYDLPTTERKRGFFYKIRDKMFNSQKHKKAERTIEIFDVVFYSKHRLEILDKDKNSYLMQV